MTGKRLFLLLVSICLVPASAEAKDVPMTPAEYQMFNILAPRGKEKQCVAVTSTGELVEQLTKLGVSKPDSVLGMIDPPVNWSQSAMLLLYQPDPPLDVVPAVRSLLKDVNKEKLTLFFRYASLEPAKSQAVPSPAASPQPAAPTVAIAAVPNKPRPLYAIEARTVGTDDTRDRSKFPSPLLLVVMQRPPFLTSKTLIECTPKL